MYSLVIYFYMLGVVVASFFNRKARLMIKGQRNTYNILRSQVKSDKQYIWFHAASLGEFEQGRMLIEKVRAEYPQYGILLTFFSPSGYEVRKDYTGADIICYLPFDTLLNAKKFLRLANPSMVFFIKYEFWQNYLSQLQKRNIPIFSVASIFRPGQIFFRSYGATYSNVLHCFTHLFVQNETSRKLLESKSITNVSIIGDTRFDRVLEIRDKSKEIPLVASFVANKKQKIKILIAGSTWPSDENIILPYSNKHPEQYLIIAPHVISEDHLQEIEHKINRPTIRFSKATPENITKVNCLIIDCYGLLSSIYKYGDIAYVGGGFGVGIHNVPEAAVFGIPTIIGPNNKKFREVQELLKVGGTFEIKSDKDYQDIMQRFIDDDEFLAAAGCKAQTYIQNGAGAVKKVFNAIDFNNLSLKEETGT